MTTKKSRHEHRRSRRASAAREAMAAAITKPAPKVRAAVVSRKDGYLAEAPIPNDVLEVARAALRQRFMDAMGKLYRRAESAEGIKRMTVARRLNVDPALVTRRLQGSNLTLDTIADMFCALDGAIDDVAWHYRPDRQEVHTGTSWATIIQSVPAMKPLSNTMNTCAWDDGLHSDRTSRQGRSASSVHYAAWLDNLARAWEPMQQPVSNRNDVVNINMPTDSRSLKHVATGAVQASLRHLRLP